MKRANNNIKNTFPYLILICVIGFVLIVLQFQGNTVNNLSTGELLKALNNNTVTELTITPNSNESVYYVEGKLKDYKTGEKFKTKVLEENLSTISEYVKENEISKYDTNSDSLLFIGEYLN